MRRSMTSIKEKAELAKKELSKAKDKLNSEPSSKLTVFKML
jgi:hypothetical protein